jgi:aspartyl-tRNA synthetase
MGAMTFLDLRDFYGVTQLVCQGEQGIDLKPEFVVEVEGVVVQRKNVNEQLATGEIEIQVAKIKVLNQAQLTPFQIEDQVSVLEETRLTYRYLDLRRPKMSQNLQIRAQINSVIRHNLEQQKFLEVETPFLGKSTPEGARDFLVPSRMNQNKFYALPQSPQLFKQLLMVGGIDRYYQIVRCFRDEDLRIDRQPEFTQLDLEMSFATSEDVIYAMENLVQELMKKVKGIDIPRPLRRMTYHDAIQDYGTDKPDLRYDLKLHDLSAIFKKTEVKLCQSFLTAKKVIKGVVIDQLITKSQLKDLTETANQNHLSGLGFIKYEREGETWSGPIASQLNQTEKKALLKEFQIDEQATILFFGADFTTISQAMGAIRVHLGSMFNLADPQRYEFL